MMPWVKATAIVLGFLLLSAAISYVILYYGLFPYFGAAVVAAGVVGVIYAVKEAL